MYQRNIFDEMPESLRIHFPNVDGDKEGAKLMLDIIKARKAGVYYCRQISVSLYSYIIARQGDEYTSLVKFIRMQLLKKNLKSNFDDEYDIILMLLDNLANNAGRKWDYEKISFRAFTRRAVKSMLGWEKEKQEIREKIIDRKDHDDPEANLCNIVELIQDSRAQSPELILEQNEKVDAFYAALYKQDRYAFKVLKLHEKGYSLTEVACKLKVSEADIYNVTKRIRRLALQFYPKAE